LAALGGARTPGRPTGPYAAHAHVHMGFSHVGPALKGAQLGPCAASKKDARAGSSVLADRTAESADPTSSTSACPRPHHQCRNDPTVVLDWCPGATFKPLSF
jgi:hypothetical protein